MGKIEEAYKQLLNEENSAVRTLKEAEFPEEAKKAIKELLSIYEKAKKRKEQNKKLSTSATEAGKVIDDINKQLLKNGVTLPDKYTSLVFTVLEQLGNS